MKTAYRLLMMLITLLLLYGFRWMPVPLPLFPAQELKIKDTNHLQKLSSESYEIQLPKISADGKWLAVKKSWIPGKIR